MESIIRSLHRLGAIKFGDFTLKSGIQSPVYIDLRVTLECPKLLEEISECLRKCAEVNDCGFDVMCGVPYTALPFATLMAVNSNCPMLIRRKEAKNYGTKKIVEGKFSQKDYCLIVEDVVSSGSSVLETAAVLRAEGLVVNDAVVVVDREQGAKQYLKEGAGINLHSLCTLSSIVDCLVKAQLLEPGKGLEVKHFAQQNQLPAPEILKSFFQSTLKRKVLSFAERAAACENPVSKRLFEIMSAKSTNLALSADVTTAQQLLNLADQLGPMICILKTHIDILIDFSPNVTEELKKLAKKHNFIIFEDRKFADIGNTAKMQYTGGIYQIAKWADLINAHALPGAKSIKGLQEGAQELDRACLLIADMSAEGSIISDDYTAETVKLANKFPTFVIGFICTKHLSENPAHVHMTPGVSLAQNADSLGQQYVTPQQAIKERGSDIVIVGRGITSAADPKSMAEQYRKAAFRAYEDCI